MIEVFRAAASPVRTRSEPGAIVSSSRPRSAPDGLERFERREQVGGRGRAATASSHPRSVAVIGASRERGTIGGEVFHNLLAAGFQGPVYPVNPQGRGRAVGRGLPESVQRRSRARWTWR